MKTGLFFRQIIFYLPFWTSLHSPENRCVEGFGRNHSIRQMCRTTFDCVRDQASLFTKQQQSSLKLDKDFSLRHHRRRIISFIGILATQSLLQPGPVLGFEGGVGGLGKTKPQTGVVLWDSEFAPVQSTSGIVSGELNVANRAVLVSFQSPWPLSGAMETRSVASGESAFVQVVESTLPSQKPIAGKEAMKQLLLDSVFAQQGKFGAYGSPFDIRIQDYAVSKEESTSSVLCRVSFTTFTPGLRESEREAYVEAIDAFNDSNHWVILVTGMTKQGFSKKRDAFAQVVGTFQVVPAPQSKLRKSQVLGELVD